MTVNQERIMIGPDQVRPSSNGRVVVVEEDIKVPPVVGHFHGHGIRVHHREVEGINNIADPN